MPEIKIIRPLVTWNLLFCMVTCQIRLSTDWVKTGDEIRNELIFKDKLPDYIKPKSYEVELDFQTIERNFFDGTCIILIDIHNQPSVIFLYAQWPHIQINTSSIILKRVDPPPPPFSYKPSDIHHNENHVLVISFYPEVLITGRYILEMSFNTSLNKGQRNLFQTSYVNKPGSRM